MIVLIAVAAICLALIAALKTKDPIRRGESGPISWRGGWRQLSEEEAARMVSGPSTSLGMTDDDD